MRISALFLLVFVISCSSSNSSKSQKDNVHTIAFGSCSHQDKTEDQLWNEVVNENPDLWIWLGDNIYGDTEDMKVMKEKYDLQKSNPGYQKLLKETKVVGIWDDHDFGLNDGGKEYPSKAGSRDLLLDFLDVDRTNEVWSREGAYQAYNYHHDDKKTKLILLDARYYRDSLKWIKEPKKALVNENGEILGDAQWEWLGKQLMDSTADFFIVGCGIQVIPTQHRFEKWSNFPRERDRLMNLIKQVKVPLIFISGDRHISEVSKIDTNEFSYPVYDLTSSSLTSPWSEPRPEENSNRIGEVVYQPNFAVMEVRWLEDLPSLSLKYVGKDNEVLQQFELSF